MRKPFLDAVNERILLCDGAMGTMLQRAGLAVPQITALLEELQAKGLPVDVRALSIEEGTAHILQALRGNGAC